MEPHNPSRQEIETRSDDTLVAFLADFLQPWRRDAACRGADRDLFFPDRGDKVEPVIEEYCNNCLVRVQCLEYQLAHTTSQTDSGIWGGMSTRQRRALRQARREGREMVMRQSKEKPESRRRHKEELIAKGYCHACASFHHLRCIRFKAKVRPCACPTCYEREERMADPRHLAPSLTRKVSA